jgi:hypothetical protein
MQTFPLLLRLAMQPFIIFSNISFVVTWHANQPIMNTKHF